MGTSEEITNGTELASYFENAAEVTRTESVSTLIEKYLDALYEEVLEAGYEMIYAGCLDEDYDKKVWEITFQNRFEQNNRVSIMLYLDKGTEADKVAVYDKMIDDDCYIYDANGFLFVMLLFFAIENARKYSNDIVLKFIEKLNHNGDGNEVQEKS